MSKVFEEVKAILEAKIDTSENYPHAKKRIAGSILARGIPGVGTAKILLHDVPENYKYNKSKDENDSLKNELCKKGKTEYCADSSKQRNYFSKINKNLEGHERYNAAPAGILFKDGAFARNARTQLDKQNEELRLRNLLKSKE
jgi:hypothetical protein